MNKAAGVLIVSHRDLILVITRQDDRDNLSLPFGFAEPGDKSLRHTAARELMEETGVVVAPFDLTHAFSAVSENGTAATTFIPTQILQWPPRLKSQPFEGYVTWAEPDELVTAHCSHATYQRMLFDYLGIPYN